MAKRSINNKRASGNRRMRIHRALKAKRRENNSLNIQVRAHEDAQNRLSHAVAEKRESHHTNCLELKKRLREWVSIHNISQRSVDDLLYMLHSYGLTSLPLNCRTLVRTPIDVNVQMIAGGHFWYNGLEAEIRFVFQNLSCDKVLQLNFSIDGLPVFNNSTTTFWPILANIHGSFE